MLVASYAAAQFVGASLLGRLSDRLGRRTNHNNLHVRGYKEEGTTTTPFDMVVLNDLDRFHLAGDVIDRVPRLGARAAYAKQLLRDKLLEHKAYVREHGVDMPEVLNWQWGKKVLTEDRFRPLDTAAEQ